MYTVEYHLKKKKKPNRFLSNIIRTTTVNIVKVYKRKRVFMGVFKSKKENFFFMIFFPSQPK